MANLPESAALLILIAIFIYLQQRRPEYANNNWLLALSLIFLSHFSWYFSRPSGTWHVMEHTTRLCCDLLAGETLLLFAGRRLSDKPHQPAILIWNVAPMIAIEVLYSFDIHQRLPYLIASIVGAIICVAIALYLRSRWWIPVIQVITWAALACFAWLHDYRQVAYCCLGAVYVAAVCHLWSRLKDTPLGKISIVASLSIWGASYLIHPQVMGHPHLRPLFDNIWSMQKYLLCIGMLITMLEREIKDNQFLAFQDQLTGVPNRRRFDLAVRAEWDRLTHKDGMLSLLLVDIDHFKQLNDHFGHTEGDNTLRQVAHVLNASLRHERDLLARYGGEEFVVILPETEKTGAENVGQRMQSMLASMNLRQNPAVGNSITVSIGATTCVFPAGASIEETIEAADRALYRAKRNGRDRIEFEDLKPTNNS